MRRVRCTNHRQAFRSSCQLHLPRGLDVPETVDRSHPILGDCLSDGNLPHGTVLSSVSSIKPPAILLLA